MTLEHTTTEPALRQRMEAGDLDATDQLATLLHDRGSYEESANLYLKTYLGGFYKANKRPVSEENFFDMIDRRLISADSGPARYMQAMRRQSSEGGERAVRAAGRAGIATFIAYLVIIYAGGVTGVLRDFSLIIGGVVAWLAWKLVAAAFES